MSYTKPSQAAFVNIKAKEFVVQLDTGQFVAVKADGAVAPHTGNFIIHAEARQVTADGSPALDANGQPITSEYNCNLDVANLTLVGGLGQYRKLMLLTILGETAAWPNALNADVLAHASIRPNIAAAAASGGLAGIAAIL